MPLLVVSQALLFALAQLLVLWLGYGMASKVAMAVLIIYFPVTAAFLDGLRRTEPGWVELARTMDASGRAILAQVRVPAALPALASGLRVAAAVAPIGAVVGEWVGSSAGLGYLMLHANARMQVDLDVRRPPPPRRHGPGAVARRRPGCEGARPLAARDPRPRPSWRRRLMALAACSPCLCLAAATATAADKLTVILDWFVNPDHAPLVVAREKGFFAAEGLEVELVAPADPNDPPKLVAAGQADVAVSYQPQLHLQVQEGLPLARIGTLVATPLNSLVVLADGPIESIADLKGREIGFSVGGFEDALLGAMLEQARAEARRRRAGQRQLLALAGADRGPGRRGDRRLPQLRAQPDGHRGPARRAFYPEEEGVPAYDELIYVAAKDGLARPELAASSSRSRTRRTGWSTTPRRPGRRSRPPTRRSTTSSTTAPGPTRCPASPTARPPSTMAATSASPPSWSGRA